MKCPKCGSFIEDGRNICPFCGNTLGGNSVGGNMNFGNQFNNNPFGNGFSNGFDNSFGQSTQSTNNVFSSGFNNNGSGFSTGAFNGNPNPPTFSNGNNNINPDFGGFSSTGAVNKGVENNSFPEIKPLKSDEKDIFDFFSENKKLLTFLGFIILIGILVFAAFQYNKFKSKEVEIEPKIENLYFEVDDSLREVSGNSQNSVVYSKSDDKGSACSITISYGTSTSGDHVNDYFQKVKTELEPERDNNNKVVNVLDIYTPSNGSMKINNVNWYYLNIFYKETKTSEPLILKQRYLTSVYKGYFYDIKLVNNNGDASCTASLNNFAKSLSFIDVKADA